MDVAASTGATLRGVRVFACALQGMCDGLSPNAPIPGPGSGHTPGTEWNAVASTAGGAFGFASGLIIQEFGYDDDVDDTLRQAIESQTGTELVDEDYGDIADSALVWWRDDDGDVDDLTDLLVDAQSNLEDAGVIWVLTPKARTAGEVPTSEIEEAAATAGMHATSAASMGEHWSGIRVSTRKR